MEAKWRSCVERLLRSWTGFQLAISMQSGGSSTAEKAQWFLEVLSNHVLENGKDLFEDELADWINVILFNDFDLVLEDDSTDWIAESLLKCWRFLGSDEAQLNNFLSSLPSDTAVQQATSQSQVVESDASDNDEEMKEEEAENPSDKKPKSRGPSTVTDEDGWTTILPRK